MRRARQGVAAVTNRELLDWVASSLKLRPRRLNDAFHSHIYCQLYDMAFPGTVPLHKVRWPARTEAEHIDNYRVLQYTFAQRGEDKRIDMQTLVKGKFQDNLQFLKWLHAQWMGSGSPGDYDPVRRRSSCKGIAKRKPRRSRRGPGGPGGRGAGGHRPGVGRAAPSPGAGGGGSVRSDPHVRHARALELASAALESPKRGSVSMPSTPARDVAGGAGGASGAGGARRRKPSQPSGVDRSLFSASLFHFHPPVGEQGLGQAYADELAELGMDSLAKELLARQGGTSVVSDHTGSASVHGSVGTAPGAAGDQQNDIWGGLDNLTVDLGDDVRTTVSGPSVGSARSMGSGNGSDAGASRDGTKRAALRKGAAGAAKASPLARLDEGGAYDPGTLHEQSPVAQQSARNGRRKHATRPGVSRDHKHYSRGAQVGATASPLAVPVTGRSQASRQPTLLPSARSDASAGAGGAAGPETARTADAWESSEKSVLTTLQDLDQRLERLKHARQARQGRRASASQGSAGTGGGVGAGVGPVRQQSHSSDGVGTGRTPRGPAGGAHNGRRGPERRKPGARGGLGNGAGAAGPGRAKRASAPVATFSARGGNGAPQVAFGAPAGAQVYPPAGSAVANGYRAPPGAAVGAPPSAAWARGQQPPGTNGSAPAVSYGYAAPPVQVMPQAGQAAYGGVAAPGQFQPQRAGVPGFAALRAPRLGAAAGAAPPSQQGGYYGAPGAAVAGYGVPGPAGYVPSAYGQPVMNYG